MMARKVLVVDGMNVARMVISNSFEELGFEVVEAKDGEEAWDLLQADPKGFNLVCSDWMMPNKTGLELLQLVRANEDTKSLAFILVTAEGEAQFVQQALDAKVDEYVRKPFTAEMIKACVDKLAEQKKL